MQKRITKTHYIQLAFFVGLFLTCGLIMLNLPRLAFPLGISYVLAIMLRPMRPAFFNASPTKRVAMILVTTFFLFLLIYPIASIIQSARREIDSFHTIVPKVENLIREKYVELSYKVKDAFGIDLSSTDVIDDLIVTIQEGPKSILLKAPEYVGAALEWSFIIPLFLFFFLKDGRRFKFEFFKLVPNLFFERAYYLFHQFNKKFGDYIFAKFMEATIVGVIIGVGLVIIGFPFALILGVVAAVTNIVPYLGPILGVIPAVIVGMVENVPTSMFGTMIILYVVANVIDLALVFPILVSKIVNLHPIVVVISVILGSHFAGVVGMVISIPLAALFKLLFIEACREIYPQAFTNS